MGPWEAGSSPHCPCCGTDTLEAVGCKVPPGTMFSEGESPHRRLSRARKSTPHLKTSSTKKERRVMVIGDSLLRGTEGPLCQLDPTCKEVCCLPGAWIHYITRKLPDLVRHSNYNPLVIIQAGSDEIAERSLKAIKRDFRGLGQLLDGVGAQVVFSSIPSVAGRDTEQTWKAWLINTWLRGWCCCRIFYLFIYFFDPGEVYSAPGLMAADGWLPPSLKREMDSSPGAGRAHQEGFRLGMKGDGVEMRLARDGKQSWVEQSQG